MHLRRTFAALTGITLFAIFLGVVAIAFLSAREASLSASDRSTAVFLAESGLEAATSIRNGSFSSLKEGQHGIALRKGLWAFTGSSIAISGGYQASVTVTSLGSGRAKVDSRVNWDFAAGRSGSVVLTQELTDWQTPLAPS